MPTTTDDIRTYYDQNTRLFLVFNRSGKADNIHRSLWTEGVTTLDDALNVTNEYIRAEIEAVVPSGARIADLGCGVGAGLMSIVPRLKDPQTALGLTLSPVQARLANQFFKRSQANVDIFFAEGDFTATPLATGAFDVVYSVEAVVHAPEPERYFAEATRLLRDGGRLIVVDDFQAGRPLSKDEARWLEAYRTGWHVPGVTTIEQASIWAETHRLRLLKNADLTPYLRLRNLPDPLARGIRSLGRLLPIRHAIVPSMLGSMALQQCLHMGVVEYRFLVFEKG